MPPYFFVGSLPHTDVASALTFVRQHSPTLPFLPQLPNANPLEDLVGQILRGFELGFWDEEACLSLKRFTEAFREAPRIKFQMAGPYTIARSLSVTLEEVIPQWLGLAKAIQMQFRREGMQGELWLQIDEPLWSSDRPLPPNYARFLVSAGRTTTGLRVGLHTCANPRPFPLRELWNAVDFMSFDFSQHPMTPEETEVWSKAFVLGKPDLVLGMVTKGVVLTEENFAGWGAKKVPVWISAPCGLYDWTPEEIETTFGKT
jgi:hypothetical protein